MRSLSARFNPSSALVISSASVSCDKVSVHRSKDNIHDTNQLLAIVPFCLHLLEFRLGRILLLLPSLLKLLVLDPQLSTQVVNNQVSINETQNLLAFCMRRSISVSKFCNACMELALAFLGLRITFLGLVVFVDRDQNLQYRDLANS